jgi:hypothetical protein
MKHYGQNVILIAFFDNFNDNICFSTFLRRWREKDRIIFDLMRYFFLVTYIENPAYVSYFITTSQE